MFLSFYAEGNQLTTIAPIIGPAFPQLLTLELGFNRIAALEPLLSIALPQLQRLSLSNPPNIQPITA
jgi:Leucine-rich repeat (LRR) protein